MTAPINLIIADDHKLFAEGLVQLFKDESDINVLDVVNDGKELLSILAKLPAELILMDINMPVLNGLDAARFVKQAYSSIKIIILSTYTDDHLVEKAKALGANGYLLKTTSKDELLQTIRLVSTGKACFPYRSPTNKTEFDRTDSFLKQFNLTKREIEILQLLKSNYTNQKIASKLSLSIYTVETHRKNIMQKLQLNSPTTLMKFIIENNL
jgi:two-component system, NarL family, nitrate/nitrite response regulator NarL